MAYANLLLEEGIDSQYICVLKPKRFATGFTLDTGSVYVADFDFGEVMRVQVDGEELTKGTSPILSASQFYYDVEEEKLYVRTSGGVDPDTLNTVAFYDLYFGTKDEHWYQSPLDDSSRVVYFEALISRSINIKSSVDDNLFGFYPIDTSAFTFINAEHIFEKHLYDSSFNKGKIEVYHILREVPGTDLDISNIKLVYDGTMGDVSYNGGAITIKCFNRVDELNVEYRNLDASFYSSTDFPNVDPNKVNKSIRYVYGVSDSFVPVNISYVESNLATTSDNRDWVCIGEQVNLANIDAGVAVSPSSTTTRTYLISAQGLRVGDQVFMDHSALTDEYAEITAVNYNLNYIEHAALSNAMVAGDFVRRSFVGAVYIIQDNALYKALYNRDYTTQNFAVGTSGFSFSTNLESNLSMPATLSPNDRVFCRVYGRTNDLTLNAVPFGDDDAESGNLCNPVMVILDLLKRFGIPESKLNIQSFIDAYALRTDALGLVIPKTADDGFKNIKNIILEIIQTSLLRLYIDDDQNFKVTALSPITTVTKTIDDMEILEGSFDYNFDYSDVISDALVEYGFQEISFDLGNFGSTVATVSSQSNVAKYLHQIESQKTFDSLHFKETDAQKLADRLIYIYGDRQGKVTLDTKNRFFDTDIEDTIAVSRTKLPGFTYDADTENVRELSVTSTQKNLRTINLELDDKKGIQDNESNW